MKEKRKKEKRSKKHKNRNKEDDRKRRRRSSSSSSSNSSEEWVVKEISHKSDAQRDDWMSMTGQLRTYTKDDMKPKKSTEEGKKNIESYNPATSSRELNPYWKDGGTGVPQDSCSWRTTSRFKKPSDDDDYFNKSRTSSNKNVDNKRRDSRDNRDYSSRSNSHTKSGSWRKCERISNTNESDNYNGPTNMTLKSDEKSWANQNEPKASVSENIVNKDTTMDSKYLSDEKMNKLAAKIVKAEILGNTKLVNELKEKLESAREYRKLHPNEANNVDDDVNESVMLTSTSSTGNTRPLMKAKGDPKSKSGKRKAKTHTTGERTKYFGNDDKYNLSEMFQQEKYGTNYEDDAELAKVAAKHTNPNDDLEDIFIDEISKNRNSAKDSEIEKQRAINQHKKIEKSLEGCEYCVDSKNMLKHLMVSCGNKVYVALPAWKSMVQGQCIITTIQHSTCVTALDEDVWEEILNYRKALTNYFNSQNQDVLFFETAVRLHRFPHVVINCVPMPRDIGDTAPIYFKKALLECEAEWSMNKKVVELKGKDIRRGVPKGLPYFWIDFGMDPGFAHVIEDQQLFPRTFAEEIISGILDLDHHSWKKHQREYGDLQRKKVLEFLKEWKAFDPMAIN